MINNGPEVKIGSMPSTLLARINKKRLGVALRLVSGALTQAWANTIATQCSNGVPFDGFNPEDYGVNTILNVANPDVAMV